MAPVGIVTAVSMKTIWKRKRAKTPTSYMSAPRKNPAVPMRPKGFPKSVMAYSWESGGVPPRAATAPTPPICMAKPQTQYPNMPMG